MIKPLFTSIKPLASLDKHINYFNMIQIKNIYNIPNPVPVNYTIAVVSYGGGLYGNYNSTTNILTNGDCQNYWSYLGIPIQNQPIIKIIPIGNATNNPNVNDNGATGENTIDIQTIGAICPSNSLTIILFISNSNTFYDTFNYIYTNYKINAISCSWGCPEIQTDYNDLITTNNLLNTISSNGINICVATGDLGSSDGVKNNQNNADFPSSSPYVTAVGGTTLICPNYIYDNLTIETAWSNGGGGFSAFFSKPDYQNNIINSSFRSTPDISSCSDPNTGVLYLINNTFYIFGGTSIAAPTIAGFLATINCNFFINPLLYSNYNSNCFHDITSGNNGGFNAIPNYDNCTGLGSINGINIQTKLSPTIKINQLSFLSSNINLSSTQSYQLNPIILPTNATNKILTYVSNNTNIATVDNKGLITGISQGNTTITVQTTDNSKLSTTINLTVTNILISQLSFLSSNINLSSTQSYQLSPVILPINATNKILTYVSNNTNIATIDNKGLITGISQGSTTITVQTTDNSKIKYLLPINVYN